MISKTKSVLLVRKYLPLITSLLLLGWLIQFVMVWFDPVPPQDFPASRLNLSDYHLFGIAAQSESVSGVNSDLSWKVIGILHAKEGAQAVIALPDGKQLVVAPGEIVMGKYRVVAILPDHIIIQQGSSRLSFAYQRPR